MLFSDSQLDRYASVFLLCLPVAQVRAAYEQLGTDTSPENIANTLWNIPTKWPQRGKLIVEMNSGQATEQTWLPRQMVRYTHPLLATDQLTPALRGLMTVHLKLRPMSNLARTRQSSSSWPTRPNICLSFLRGNRWKENANGYRLYGRAIMHRKVCSYHPDLRALRSRCRSSSAMFTLYHACRLR